MLKTLLREYEEVLIGNKNCVSSIFFSFGVEANEKMALNVFRYAFTTYMHWNAQDIYDYVSSDILKKLKLESFLKYIRFPGEVDKTNGLYYLAHMLYPEQIQFDSFELTLRVYDDIVQKKVDKYPKDFFYDTEGSERLKICFRHMLSNYCPFHSIDEMYKFFANQTEATALLRKYRLNVPCTDLYETPLILLHNALDDEQKDEFLFQYYSYETMSKKYAGSLKRRRRK